MSFNNLSLSHPLDPTGSHHGGGDFQDAQDGFDRVSFYSVNGNGNNIANPTRGAAGTEEVRLAPANFSDGSTPVTGPNPRVISNTIFAAPQSDDPAGRSAYFHAFGQFVDHDLDLNVAGTGTMSVTVPAGDSFLVPGSKISITRGQVDPANGKAMNSVTFAVGTPLSRRPPHRSVRAEFPHTAPTSGV
jgi:hypothetical protein